MAAKKRDGRTQHGKPLRSVFLFEHEMEALDRLAALEGKSRADYAVKLIIDHMVDRGVLAADARPQPVRFGKSWVPAEQDEGLRLVARSIADMVVEELPAAVARAEKAKKEKA